MESAAKGKIYQRPIRLGAAGFLHQVNGRAGTAKPKTAVLKTSPLKIAQPFMAGDMGNSIFRVP